MFRQIATLGLGVASLAAASAAQADDWLITLSARAQAVVPYEGAGHDIFVPTPAISIRRANRPDRPSMPDDGLSIALIDVGPFVLGPVARLRGKRSADGDHTGLREVPLAIEPGLFVTVWPADWVRLRGEARKGVRGHSGWIGDAELDFVGRRGPWTATVGPRAGWGDRNYMDTYFGVTPAEAAASPLIDTAYSPKGGQRFVGLEATLAHRWGGAWQTTANFGFHRLGSIAGDSPIVHTIGSRDEFSGGVGVKYSFTWHR
jgi:outer membrane protein